MVHCIYGGCNFKIELYFFILKINFDLENSVDPDEMLHYFTWVFTVCQSMYLEVTSIYKGLIYTFGTHNAKYESQRNCLLEAKALHEGLDGVYRKAIFGQI